MKIPMVLFQVSCQKREHSTINGLFRGMAFCFSHMHKTAEKAVAMDEFFTVVPCWCWYKIGKPGFDGARTPNF